MTLMTRMDGVEQQWKITGQALVGQYPLSWHLLGLIKTEKKINCSQLIIFISSYNDNGRGSGWGVQQISSQENFRQLITSQ